MRPIRIILHSRSPDFAPLGASLSQQLEASTETGQIFHTDSVVLGKAYCSRADGTFVSLARSGQNAET